MTDSDSLLTQAAQFHLTQGQREIANACLDAALKRNPGNIDAHNLREVHRLPGCYSDWVGVSAQIHAQDDIFRFFAKHPQSMNPVRDYLADGWRSMLELHRLANSIGKPLYALRSFLEFACGHGRLTRHLVHDIAPDRITVSDVVPGTVDFLRSELGVQGFYSTLHPRALVAPARYEFIFVLSLFTHLPQSLWSDWLQVLYGLLEPQGCLVFSVHGEKSARDAGVALNGSGFAFFPDSESSALESANYGVTYTSTDFVARAVHEHLPKGTALKCLPGLFWSSQDAVVIHKTT